MIRLYCLFLFLLLAFYGCKNENLGIAHDAYVFGIDVSHYQGNINWRKVKTSHHPIEFVFIRATMGQDGKDQQFEVNWKGAKAADLVRGVYHYYRPNENSSKQFQNFIQHVELSKGDFFPVLDVEEMSKYGVKNLQKGVANWLALAEEKFGVKPILYTSRSFYNNYLKNEFKAYPLWVASYSSKNKLRGLTWNFHQFTEKVRVNGIVGTVDGNDFNGTKEELSSFCF